MVGYKKNRKECTKSEKGENEIKRIAKEKRDLTQTE